MDSVKKFLKEKSVGYWLMAGAFVCGLVAMILFFSTDIEEFRRIYEGATAAGFIVFVVLSAIMLVYELRIVKYLTAATGLYTLAMYIVCEIEYIANIISAIDDPVIYSSFVTIIVFSVLSFGLAMASACMARSGLAREKKEKKIKGGACVDAREEAET